MIFDLDMIKKHYSKLDNKIDLARKAVNRPLSLTEKILYSHINDEDIKAYDRGKDYVNFYPDRVAMQDATAQMALLQFMQAGQAKVQVPSTVHCDHLIQAESGAEADLKKANLKRQIN